MNAKDAFLDAAQSRWPEQQVHSWYQQQKRLMGANYIPASAVNQLEMWQADTFDPQRIDLELSKAHEIGFNTIRVFLHDLLWLQDSEGFKDRIDTFLNICDKHEIKPMFVLFDSCWNPHPKLGPQPQPVPGVHNSGWVQGPGFEALQDPAQIPRLKAYVEGVVGAFAKDKRVLAWDIWNEPCNSNPATYGEHRHIDKIVELLPRAFEWARSAAPEQPLTSGVWIGDWSAHDRLSPMAKVQLEQSDFITFHNYDDANEFEKRIQWLQNYKRPIVCTEFIARSRDNTFEKILPVMFKHNVGGTMWGFVEGKTQTYFAWDSCHKPRVGENHDPSEIWFHDVLRNDLRPYCEKEYSFLKSTLQPQILVASPAPSGGPSPQV